MSFNSISPITIQCLGKTFIFERPISREAFHTIFSEYKVPQDGYGIHYWKLLSDNSDVRYDAIKKFSEYPLASWQSTQLMIRTVTIIAMTSDEDVRVRRCAAKLLGPVEGVEVDTNHEALKLLMEEDADITEKARDVLYRPFYEDKNLAYIIQNLFPALEKNPSKTLSLRGLLSHIINCAADSKDDEINNMVFEYASKLYGFLSNSEDVNHKIASLWILEDLLKKFGSNEALRTNAFRFLSRLLDENASTDAGGHETWKGNNSLQTASCYIAMTLIRLHFPNMKVAEKYNAFFNENAECIIQFVTEQQSLEMLWNANSKVIERLCLSALRHPDIEIREAAAFPLLLLVSTGYKSEELKEVIKQKLIEIDASPIKQNYWQYGRPLKCAAGFFENE